MASSPRHEAQAQHNQRVLSSLGEDALDWQITLMMYVSLHGLRAYISRVRPGYAGNDFRYDSFSRVLEREVTPSEVELSAAFDALVKLSYRTRYQCPDEATLKKMLGLARPTYLLILERLRILDIQV